MIRLDQIAKSSVLGAAVKPQMDKLDKATKDFEAMLIKDLMSSMRKGSPNITESSYTSQMVRDMADQAMSESISKSGSLGIAKQLFTAVAPAAARQEFQRQQALLKNGELQILNKRKNI